MKGLIEKEIIELEIRKLNTIKGKLSYLPKIEKR